MTVKMIYELPSAEDYCALRIKAGMTARELKFVQVALPKSLFSVILRHDEKLIAMGRVIGDLGCHVQVVDIVVDPEFQKQGLGNKIMIEVMNFIRISVPKTCFVNLFADVNFLYEKFGFVDSVRSKGMYLDWKKFT
ncbi:MAG: GNAT family N-acetyltransferase [Bdellovibrionota bacterium]